MKWLEIQQSNPLQGRIKVPGSKNSSLGLLPAACLSDEPVHLHNIPDIQDYRVICEIAEDIGLKITKNGDQITLDPRGIHSAVVSPEKASAFRASYYFIGALLAKFKKVTIGYPGGDNFGSRPIDQHIKGFERLGAKCTFFKEYYQIEAEELRGNEIYFDVITMGATMNILLAAVRAKGKTVLYNAARDPEVVDVAILLNNMGAKIRGAGTDKITIEGVDSLQGCTHSVIPDRLIAGAFLMTAGLTGGRITVEEIIPEHLHSCTTKLEEAGLTIEMGDSWVTAYIEKELQAVQVKTGMYPALGTDFQQPMTTMLTRANGNSLVVDPIFPERTNHCVQLNRMGANIAIHDGSFTVMGNRTLTGNWVHATDVRAGISLILAGLVAKGTTYITGVEHIERGYADVVQAFGSLGARIKMCEDPAMTEIPQMAADSSAV